MKFLSITLTLILIILLVFFYQVFFKKTESQFLKPDNNLSLPSQFQSINNTQDSNSATFLIVAQNLDTPWAIAFLPDNSLLVTERPGRVRLIDKSGQLDERPVATIQKVSQIGEGGLLGITLHPYFSTNSYVYLYYTYSNSGDETLNRVVRMKYLNNSLIDEEIIVDQIPGAPNHNGGRIKFGPDGNLYITTGDAQNPSKAQDIQSLAGKILRVTDGGKVVLGNPFQNLVYSYGHRNAQGLAWDRNGQLWETEHGPSGLQSGNDEINLISPSKNYGWPTIQGTQTNQGMEPPIKTSGTHTTWAPAGAAIMGNRLFFGGLRGQALYQAEIQGKQISNFSQFFTEKFGRIREVITGPDGYLYLTTSNEDGRGTPKPGDDKIIKMNPQKL